MTALFPLHPFHRLTESFYVERVMKDLLKESNENFLNKHEDHIRKVQRDLFRSIQKPNAPKDGQNPGSINFLNELLKM